MTSNDDVAKAFVSGRKRTGKHIYTDGKSIWSYGKHFYICTKLSNMDYLFNQDKYSVTTSRHQSIVMRYLNHDRTTWYCDTAEIQRAVERPELPVIIYRDKEVKYLDTALDILKKVCISNGMKRFPMKKIKEMLNSKIVVDCL